MAGLQETFERIGASLEHHLTASHAAGAALAVTDREEILGVVVRGMADVASATPVRPETRFQIGSISKSFAAIIAMQELDADRLLGPLGMTSSVAAITDEIWTDHATGYEPMLTDRPAQLRHPLAPAPRIVSNTADGSIVSTVVDMSAYARLLLARGDHPDGRGGRILSEDGFTRLMANAVDDTDHA